MSELSMIDQLISCDCYKHIGHVCIMCQIIKPEISDLRAKLQAAEAELAEWRETNPTHASLLAERKRADDAEADRTDLSEKLGGLSDKLKDAENDLDLVTHDLEMAESKRLQCIERCAELRSRAEAAEAEVARLKEELEWEKLPTENAEADRLRTRIAALEAALAEVVRISDRKHDAWDRAHALLDGRGE